MKKSLATTAMAGIIAAGLMAASGQALANKKFEKCYGIAKAGKNDCQTSNTACATVGMIRLSPSSVSKKMPSLPRVIVGVFTLGLRLAGADAQWTFLLIGVLIIAAVAVDQWIRKVSA